jgi:DNA-binding transcriptional regulator YiaG
MTADELLRRYPRETLRWLRGQLALTQSRLAMQIGVDLTTVRTWESRRNAIPPQQHPRLAALLATQLATPEGVAFARSLGRGEA